MTYSFLKLWPHSLNFQKIKKKINLYKLNRCDQSSKHRRVLNKYNLTIIPSVELKRKKFHYRFQKLFITKVNFILLFFNVIWQYWIFSVQLHCFPILIQSKLDPYWTVSRETMIWNFFVLHFSFTWSIMALYCTKT